MKISSDYELISMNVIKKEAGSKVRISVMFLISATTYEYINYSEKYF